MIEPEIVPIIKYIRIYGRRVRVDCFRISCPQCEDSFEADPAFGWQWWLMHRKEHPRPVDLVYRLIGY